MPLYFELTAKRVYIHRVESRIFWVIFDILAVILHQQGNSMLVFSFPRPDLLGEYMNTKCQFSGYRQHSIYRLTFWFNRTCQFPYIRNRVNGANIVKHPNYHIEIESKRTPFSRRHYHEWNLWNSNEISFNMLLMVILTIIQYWFWWRLNVKQSTSRYLYQWWLTLLPHVCVIRSEWSHRGLLSRYIHAHISHCNPREELVLYVAITWMINNWYPMFELVALN